MARGDFPHPFVTGSTKGRILARKIVACLRLASEQLSSQDHYDFGMRNVKSILTAAGNLKQRNGDEDEDILCLRAINDCNLPKFVTADLPLFQWITSDLFDVNLPLPSYGPLFAALDAQALAQNIQLNDYLRVKITQLYFPQTSPAFIYALSAPYLE